MTLTIRFVTGDKSARSLKRHLATDTADDEDVEPKGELDLCLQNNGNAAVLSASEGAMHTVNVKHDVDARARQTAVDSNVIVDPQARFLEEPVAAISSSGW